MSQAPGHDFIAEIVGEKLLKKALNRSNYRDFRIGAFYLGNWLTDFSQFVDPVAYKKAEKKLEPALAAKDALFERFELDAPAWLPDTIEQRLDTVLDDLRKELRTASQEIDDQFRAFFGEGRNGNLANAFRSFFRYLGYAKFVLQEDGSGPTAMHKKSYFAIYDARFTQYYPHEHLDRPETHGRLAVEPAKGPLNRFFPKGKGPPKNDLYAYLRDDIKVAAGLLAYLDGGVPDDPPRLSWAAGTFHPKYMEFTDAEGCQQAVADDNVSWNMHLAQLGHALHAVEDFYAHSTFVEHASTALPDTYARGDRWEGGEILHKRLKKWEPWITENEDKWHELDPDPHVVTGYFDFCDTAISVAHFLEHKTKRPTDRVGQTWDKIAEYKYRKLFIDTLELIDNPAETWKNPDNNPNNRGYDEDKGNLAVKWLRKEGHGINLAEERETRLNKIASWITEHRDFPDDPEAKKDFVDAVKKMGAIVGAGVLAISLYRLIKHVGEFLTNPLVWLKDRVPEYVYKRLKDIGETYLRDLVIAYIGGERIGCHSLLAKDSGSELFYKGAQDCAKAVHYYIVHTLTRHSREQTIPVCRSADGEPSRVPIFRWEWIDWLELLEYHLAHPTVDIPAAGSIVVSETRFHITKEDPHSIMSPDSYASLARQYAPTFEPGPEGPQEWDWELIARANLPLGVGASAMSTYELQKVVNRVLANQPTRAVKARKSHAFRPGVLVRIPYQRAKIRKVENTKAQKRWWYPVIVDDWRIMERWYQDGHLCGGAPPQAHRWIPISRKEQIKLVDDARALRSRLEKEYK